MILLVFLADRERLTGSVVHRAIHDWLSGCGGCRNVRYRPSRRRREQVHADIEPTAFLGSKYDATAAQLEVQFEFPRTSSFDYYRVQWVEPERNLSVGWHQDDHRPDLGECHLQLDHGERVVDVRAAEFLDAHPLNVLDRRLGALPGVLDAIAWRDGTPVFEF